MDACRPRRHSTRQQGYDHAHCQQVALHTAKDSPLKSRRSGSKPLKKPDSLGIDVFVRQIPPVSQSIESARTNRFSALVESSNRVSIESHRGFLYILLSCSWPCCQSLERIRILSKTRVISLSFSLSPLCHYLYRFFFLSRKNKITKKKIFVVDLPF